MSLLHMKKRVALSAGTTTAFWSHHVSSLDSALTPPSSVCGDSEDYEMGGVPQGAQSSMDFDQHSRPSTPMSMVSGSNGSGGGTAIPRMMSPYHMGKVRDF